MSVDPNGGFAATFPSPGTYTFTYKAQNSQGTPSAIRRNRHAELPGGSGLTVTVYDGSRPTTHDSPTIAGSLKKTAPSTSTPLAQPTPLTGGLSTLEFGTIVPTFGTNFHTSYMPLVATGCTGPLSCETGQTVLGSTGGVRRWQRRLPHHCHPGQTPVDPSQVASGSEQALLHLGSAGRRSEPVYRRLRRRSATALGAYDSDGSRTPIAATVWVARQSVSIRHDLQQTSVTILTQPSSVSTAKLSVFVFEDDFPLNGEQDGGGGIDVLVAQ